MKELFAPIWSRRSDLEAVAVGNAGNAPYLQNDNVDLKERYDVAERGEARRRVNKNNVTSFE